jgi:predicted PurR-regulated permease PerM
VRWLAWPDRFNAWQEFTTMDQRDSERENTASGAGGGSGAAHQDATLVVLRAAVLVLITALVLYLCWQIVAPFVNAFTWAFAIAVACSPLRQWLFRRMPRSVASILIIALLLIVIVVPVSFLFRQLLHESQRAQAMFQGSLQSEGWRATIASNRWLASLWDWGNQQFDFEQIGRQLNGMVARSIGPVVARSVRVIAQIGAALLALFFFLRDQEVVVEAIGRVLPLSEGETDRLFTRVASAVRASVLGRLFIGMLQGSLGGFIFAILGLPAPIFWGAVMSLLATLPFVGAPFVWVPTCAILLLKGHWIKALVLALWGLIVINPVDNVLYPVLVGSRIGLHPLMLFLAFVGGMIAFGPTGLILGPCIVAVAVGLADVWEGRQAAFTGQGSE